jgi:hypothetical protein
MKRRFQSGALLFAATLLTGISAMAANGGWTVVGWNNLGMHCMDSDYSIFSILPPYNTIHAQLFDPTGQRITSGSGYVVTYEAVADPAGSINRTSVGKSNFWQFAMPLFSLPQPLPADTGLTGVMMPGAANIAQPMSWDAANGWWIAEGLPLTPYDDASHKNPYPMMRIQARTTGGALIASADIVAPVSDEMDCSACHASTSGPAARPASGWVNDQNPERDYRLNILRLHDEKAAANPSYAPMLSSLGYDPAGLYATSAVRPVLCATCHASNALGTAGVVGVLSLTAATHGLHAQVTDPGTGLLLDNSNNRATCYRCHPGSTTRCLRGAMGRAVAADGTLAIQCQDCHGSMSAVGAPTRQGWLDEPACQNCHTGTATHNNGAIRYTSVFDSTGQSRQAVDQTFATNPNTPASGISLYRYSSGHGGVKCEGCHGSTHAEFASTHLNDNVQNLQLQGHEGMLVECATCHGTAQAANTGGPHGMHTVGQDWIDAHGTITETTGIVACEACHGADYRGTVLSRSQADRTLTGDFGTKSFWRGFQIGCYTCHNGPSSETANPNRPAVVVSTSAQTLAGVSVQIPLSASDRDGNVLTLRVVSQPDHGTAGLVNRTATYYPEPGFVGSDAFTFAAWDGATDSNLASVAIQVTSDRIFANGFQ